MIISIVLKMIKDFLLLPEIFHTPAKYFIRFDKITCRSCYYRGSYIGNFDRQLNRLIVSVSSLGHWHGHHLPHGGTAVPPDQSDGSRPFRRSVHCTRRPGSGRICYEDQRAGHGFQRSWSVDESGWWGGRSKPGSFSGSQIIYELDIVGGFDDDRQISRKLTMELITCFSQVSTWIHEISARSEFGDADTHSMSSVPTFICSFTLASLVFSMIGQWR